MRFPVRLVGLKLLGGALLAGVLQFQLWAETERFVPLGLGQMWLELHPSSFHFVQAAIEQHVWPPLWDPLLVTVLRWEAWAVMGCPALVLLVLPVRQQPRERVVRWSWRALQIWRDA